MSVIKNASWFVVVLWGLMVVDSGEVVGVAEVGGVEVLVVVEIVLFEFEILKDNLPKLIKALSPILIADAVYTQNTFGEDYTLYYTYSLVNNAENLVIGHIPESIMPILKNLIPKSEEEEAEEDIKVPDSGSSAMEEQDVTKAPDSGSIVKAEQSIMVNVRMGVVVFLVALVILTYCYFIKKKSRAPSVMI